MEKEIEELRGMVSRFNMTEEGLRDFLIIQKRKIETLEKLYHNSTTYSEEFKSAAIAERDKICKIHSAICVILREDFGK